MLEFGNWQASCAARRLVGQTIHAVERRTAAAMAPPDKRSASSKQRRHFSYSFAPPGGRDSNQANNESRAQQQQSEFLVGGGGGSTLIRSYFGQSATADELQRRPHCSRQDHGRRQRHHRSGEPRAGKWKIAFSFVLVLGVFCSLGQSFRGIRSRRRPVEQKIGLPQPITGRQVRRAPPLLRPVGGSAASVNASRRSSPNQRTKGPAERTGNGK